MDGVLLAMLLGLLAVTLYGRRRAQRRSSTTSLAAGAIACALATLTPQRAPTAGTSAVAPAWPSPRRHQRISNRHWEHSGHDVDVEIQDDQPTYELFGGYRWCSGFALEASLVSTSVTTKSDVTASTTSPGTLLADTETVLADSGRGISAALAWNWRMRRELRDHAAGRARTTGSRSAGWRAKPDASRTRNSAWT